MDEIGTAIEANVVVGRSSSRSIRPPRYRGIRRQWFSTDRPFSSPALLGRSIGRKTVDGERWRSVGSVGTNAREIEELLSVDVRVGG